MKTIVPFLLFAALLLCSATSFSQSVVSSETFPQSFNTNSSDGRDGNFAGNQGNWTIVASSNFSIEVDDEEVVSSPRALGFKVNSNSASSNNSATSPAVNLAFGGCQPSSATFSFSLMPKDVDNGNNSYTFSLQFFNGSAWATVWSKTAHEIFESYRRGSGSPRWTTIDISLPSAYWVSNFQYRFVAAKGTTSGGSGRTTLWVDNVEIETVTTGPSFPDFSATPVKITDGGTPGGGYQVGDVYRYTNVVTAPVKVHAEIKIEAIVNATIDQLDNNADGVAQRFQPRIGSGSTLNADKEGYVQFAITFKKASDNSIVSLNGLRYRHFDIDGNTGNNHAFRETGWITGQSSVLVNNPSDLSGGSSVITDGGYSWKKVLGELEEHDAISSDADVYFTATYGSVSTIRFRLGYLFDETRNGANEGSPVREYGTEFGCFSVQEDIPLPLTLLNFNGSYNNKALLTWTTADEKNVDRFEIERSTDGAKFSKAGTLAAKGVNGAVTSYQLTDDLSGVSGSVFYYRLKSIDFDGKFTYSKVLTLRKDQKAVNEITVVPNPVVNSNAVIRISSTEKGVADLRIVDFSGRVIKSQKLNLYEGINTIPVGDIGKLSTGMYTVQLFKGTEVFNSKFIVRQ
jgi:hypothetical protein